MTYHAFKRNCRLQTGLAHFAVTDAQSYRLTDSHGYKISMSCMPYPLCVSTVMPTELNLAELLWRGQTFVKLTGFPGG